MKVEAYIGTCWRCWGWTYKCLSSGICSALGIVGYGDFLHRRRCNSKLAIATRTWDVRLNKYIKSKKSKAANNNRKLWFNSTQEICVTMLTCLLKKCDHDSKTDKQCWQNMLLEFCENRLRRDALPVPSTIRGIRMRAQQEKEETNDRIINP